MNGMHCRTRTRYTYCYKERNEQQQTDHSSDLRMNGRPNRTNWFMAEENKRQHKIWYQNEVMNAITYNYKLKTFTQCPVSHKYQSIYVLQTESDSCKLTHHSPKSSLRAAISTPDQPSSASRDLRQSHVIFSQHISSISSMSYIFSYTSIQ